MGRYHYVFPKWSNLLLPSILIFGAVAPLYVVMVVAWGFSPNTTDVGYMPTQPVPYSHELHAGKLGIDCRYCHNTVEYTDQANIPATQTCMNCHTAILKDSEKIKPLLESYTTGKPVEWVRVHDLPQYAYFSHQAHVTRGVSCVECHGRVDRMAEVFQEKPLSMSWCLECHREPDAHLRDPKDVFDLAWGLERTLEERLRFGAEKRAFNNINPSQDCSICHR
jgi:menaquinone reductase, multiheme cytochrome c subunit